MKKIIITGTPRTGTTALAGLLSHSTNVLTFNEIGLYDMYHTRCVKRNSDILKDSTNARYLELKGLTEKDVDDFAVGNFTNKGSIEFLGDKSPAYCASFQKCNYIRQHHPDAYFIFTYRNPCATIYSGIKRSEIEKDEEAGWYFKSLEESTQSLILRTTNWALSILPYVRKKIIIDYDHYINNVDLLINDLNLFLDTKLNIDNPESLYKHINPNAYRDNMSKEMIDYIQKETEALDRKVKNLLT